MNQAERVLARYMLAKGKGTSLVPEFKAAIDKLRAGDYEPVRKFLTDLVEKIQPGGNRPDWFDALSTPKMSQIRTLYREAQVQLSRLDIKPRDGDQVRWDQYRAGELEKLLKPLRTFELASAIGDQDVEIKHGPFTVIPIPGVSKKQVDDALAALDEAASKIRPKFPMVLYGKVYLSKHIAKGVAAKYEYATDAMALNVSAKKRFSDVFTLIHEMGHRHDAKFLKNENRQTYWGLSTRKVLEAVKFDKQLREQMADEVVSLAKLKIRGQPTPKMSDLLVLWLKSPHPTGDIPKTMTKFLNLQIGEEDLRKAVMGSKDGEVMTDKILHGPLHVTPYGGSSPKENYADGFAHFCLGMDMPAELAAILTEESK